MIRYAIQDRLAGSSRPGYSPGGDRPVPKCVVDAWIADAKARGIRSIICLLADEHLKLYADLGVNLPSYYSQHGFEVAHVPVRDHQRPPLDANALERIAQAYVALPKPVLVHCSAGIDRTGRALEYLAQRFVDLAPSSTLSDVGCSAPRGIE
jgi:protein tyrosine phosphatase (PTP) superfamily phosphohydrolase (DUF442 family)